jgi:SAM-dependent methyltransferase
MTSWDERFRKREYPVDPDPDDLLQNAVSTFPEGRALDIATGTGRNAVFLAGEGYEVDALDKSREGLKIARENAEKRDVEHRCNWIEADAFEYEYPEATYDVITIQSFQVMARLSDIKAALAEDGILYYKVHMRTAESLDYGPSNRHRVAANELLRACLDLTVLSYREYTTDDAEHRGAYAQILARNSSGHTQPHPEDSILRS